MDSGESRNEGGTQREDSLQLHGIRCRQLWAGFGRFFLLRGGWD